MPTYHSDLAMDYVVKEYTDYSRIEETGENFNDFVCRKIVMNHGYCDYTGEVDEYN
jgi:hypothetical protein